MGKTYIDAVKYVIHAHIVIDGMVEKPDVVGAIFGQTEGLLGDELDLRELQKSGRIGRIEVNMNAKAGKSEGDVVMPSSLDRVETSIIAAALETVDRIGPCNGKIVVKSIEDTRTLKRNYVLNRAKEILTGVMGESIPESQEITERVRDKARMAEIQTWGPEKLPAGPNVEEADTIILVEGRADVLNLLRHDIKNVIGMHGKKVTKSISELSKKTLILFVDGDRGGDLIVKELAQVGDIDYVAKAPPGREVEELTKKEILKCLRTKEPLPQFISKLGSPRYIQAKPKPQTPQGRYNVYSASKMKTPEPEKKPSPAAKKHPAKKTEPKKAAAAEPKDTEETKKLKDVLSTIQGSLKAQLLDKKLELIEEVPVREVLKKLESDIKGLTAVVLDGIITQRLADAAEKAKIGYLVGVREGKLSKKPKTVKVVSGK